MIFVLDVEGTLDHASHAQWQVALQAMKKNGNDVVLCTSSDYSKYQEDEFGFKKSEFSKVYIFAQKSDPDYYCKIIAGDFNVAPSSLCLIDDNCFNTAAADKAGTRTILFEDFLQMKRDLEQHDVFIPDDAPTQSFLSRVKKMCGLK